MNYATSLLAFLFMVCLICCLSLVLMIKFPFAVVNGLLSMLASGIATLVAWSEDIVCR